MPDHGPHVNTALTAPDWEDLVERAAVKAAAVFLEGQGGPDMAGRKKAWAYQRPEQVAKHGKQDAPWWVYWRDPDGVKHGKSCGPGKAGKRLADKEAERLHAELVTGTYGSQTKKTWAEFRVEYEAKILASKAPSTRTLAVRCLNNFERLAKPGRLAKITTQTIDGFIAARRVEVQAFNRAGRKDGRKVQHVTPQTIKARTVNADLRSIKTALRVAAEWGWLKDLPRFRFLPVPEMLPTYVTPDDFDKLYEACASATKPAIQGILPADWWRAFLTVAYMTGLRKGELLALTRAQVDLDAGMARLWNQKCNREDLVPFHAVAVAALRALPATFADVFFPWPHHTNTLWRQFHRIQEAAGLKGKYTPHALRRAFGTMNAGRVGGPKALQFLMRHKSGQTTQAYYVNPLEGITESVDRLFVPGKLRTGTGV